MKERDSYKHWIETVFISFLCTLILSGKTYLLILHVWQNRYFFHVEYNGKVQVDNVD